MEHDEVREQLQLAAVEPDGLDRLMAGDTPLAAAIAGHLAGCDACTTELERLRRGGPLIRDVVRTSPPADLRERTLAYVRDRGIQRGPAITATASPAPTTVRPTALAPSGRGVGFLPWAAAVAAAVLISVAATSFLVGLRVDAQIAALTETNRDLAAVTTGTLSLTAEKDVQRVVLASTDGSTTHGTLLFSPSTTDVVVVATGLTPPPTGQEYRCWVEMGGVRQPIGRMFFGGDLAYWIGPAKATAAVTSGARFGVSLSSTGASGTDSQPVIAGTL